MVATAVKSKQIKDLGILELKKPIRVIMLPSDANSVIVNYSANSAIQITCTFSARERQLSIKNDYGKTHKLKIKTSPLMMSIGYADLPTPTSNHITNIKILGYNNRDKTKIWAAPYMLSNVFENGQICFGSLGPSDLRAASNLFWAAPFNDELIDISEEIVDEVEAPILGPMLQDKGFLSSKVYMKKYKDEVFSRQEWQDYTNEICGTKYWACPNPSEAVLVTSNKELLKQIPKNYWRKQGNQAIIIAKAKKTKKCWVFEAGSYKFKLALEAVVTKIPTIPNHDDF